MVLRNAFEDLALDSTVARRFGTGRQAYAGLLTSSGDHAVITPALGNQIRIVWVAFVPSRDAAAANLVTVKFAGGDPLYIGYAMAHWESFEGPVDTAVIVNTATAEAVAVTIHYEEF